MDKSFVKELISEIEQIEEKCVQLFKDVPLRPSERLVIEGDEEIIVLRWYPDDEGKKISREIKRRYEAWYHAGLKLLEEYMPYQIREFQSVYDVMISYITLNRYANTTNSKLAGVEKRFDRGFVDIYLDEFSSVIDGQANPIRSLISLPGDSIAPSCRCFITGFPLPNELRENPNLVFVIIPFHKPFDDIYELGIKETVKSLGLQCLRSDEITHTHNVICTAICQPIRAARYIVADITGKNPNVFYELGLAHARTEDADQQDKHVIILTQNIEDVPFDLRNMNIIHYDNIVSVRAKLGASLIDLMKSSGKK